MAAGEASRIALRGLGKSSTPRFTVPEPHILFLTDSFSWRYARMPVAEKKLRSIRESSYIHSDRPALATVILPYHAIYTT